jgi:hypothetical protein
MIDDRKLIIATGAFSCPLTEKVEKLAGMAGCYFFWRTEFSIPWIGMESQYY